MSERRDLNGECHKARKCGVGREGRAGNESYERVANRGLRVPANVVKGSPRRGVRLESNHSPWLLLRTRMYE